MQKTAYDVRISDWSSDVCSSDLARKLDRHHRVGQPRVDRGDGGGARASAARAGEARAAFPGSGADAAAVEDLGEIGRASCRERVCQYVLISVVAAALKKKKTIT